MAHKIWITKKYDIRPVDLDSGKRLAIPYSEYLQCACCGKRIVKINELSNGNLLGSECADVLPHTRNGQNVTRVFGLSAKQATYFQGLQS